MKILLIIPPMQADSCSAVPCLGISYIAQELTKNGYDCEVLNIDSFSFSKTEVINFIKNSEAQVIGIGGLVTIYPYLAWLIPEIRRLRSHVEIILGGAVASALRERCFERFNIDYEVIGEGEVTIIELLKEMVNSRNFSLVKGIGFRDGNKIVFTEKRELMPSLEGVPIFDDSLFPMKQLLKRTGLHIHTQRGCPFNCTFCFNPFRVVTNSVRYRPFINVIQEIEFFHNKYKNRIKNYALSGECSTINKQWIIDFCKEILKRKIRIKYKVSSRVDTIDEERLQWLRKSGCTIIAFGLESGSEKILRIINKGTTVVQAKRAVSLAKKYIPYIEPSIMLGYIGENKDTLKETVEFCKEINVKPELCFATPFPGTELYKMALEMGKIKDEEEYLMGLDKQNIFNFKVNLTDMLDEEARYELSATVKEIKRYYLQKEIKSLKIIPRALREIKKGGLKKTVREVYFRARSLYN